MNCGFYVSSKRDWYKATVYRHINKQYYSIGRIDLPRAVKFKPRKTKSGESVPKAVKKNRTYEDFLEFCNQNPNVPHIEIDTVIGRITDNGGEFSNVLCFELDCEGNKETSVFFCHPYSSCEKGKIEKNHTLFRDIVPKGKSFDKFTQETVNLIFSHVNAVKREIFNGKSPYELFTFSYSEELASLFGISYVAPEDVVQSPKLLKNNLF